MAAERIGSDTPPAQRRDMIHRFADGELPILANVDLITTGFDLASQVGRDVTVEAIIMARPTASLALCLQMWGRPLRRKPYPAIILDHVGNSARHGWPDDDRSGLWSLDGGERKAASKSEVPPPVTCETCYAQTRRPLPPVCPHCGTAWPVSTRKEMIEDETVELITYDRAAREIDRAAKEAAKAQAAKSRKSEEAQCRTLADLEALGKLRGYNVGWDAHRWAARQSRASARW